MEQIKVPIFVETDPFLGFYKTIIKYTYILLKNVIYTRYS